jgi:hypothetical protein
MSDNLVNQITLDCLTNKEQYNRCLQNKISKIVCRQEKKFYKKRLVDLTKDLLSKPSVYEKTIFPDVKYAFDVYIKTCVEYFKSLDNNDILQEEYKNIEPGLVSKEEEKVIQKTQQEADKLLMRSINIVKPLDKFVKRTSTKKEEEVIIPKQKEIDLADPALKNKGIIKKKKKENIL